MQNNYIQNYQNNNKFLGKSVNIAVENINNKISAKLKGLNVDDQKKIVGVSYEKHHDIVWFKWLNPIRSLISDKKNNSQGKLLV